jgi:hypothetical protein
MSAANQTEQEMSPPTQIQEYVRHPVYWQEETRHMVLRVSYAFVARDETELTRRCCQVENTKYYLSLGMLTMVSPELKGIFDIPPSPPKPGEAAEGTIDNPVFIPQLTTVAFDDFLGWILKP